PTHGRPPGPHPFPYTTLFRSEAGTTLLKNGGVLPLSSGGSIAVIGPAADTSPTYAGGGSAYVLPSGTVSPLAGIKAAAGSGTSVDRKSTRLNSSHRTISYAVF